MKFTSMLALVGAATAADSCCNVCDESKGFIKAYSIDHIFNMCGECCLQPGDFWKYKIFEFGLTKVDDVKATPCHDAGFTNFLETDTHGVPGLIAMTLDMYKKPADSDDSVHRVVSDKIDEISDKIDNIDFDKVSSDFVNDGLDWLINGN